jgi:flagellar L-ring protein precursor FlgH
MQNEECRMQNAERNSHMLLRDDLKARAVPTKPVSEVLRRPGYAGHSISRGSVLPSAFCILSSAFISSAPGQSAPPAPDQTPTPAVQQPQRRLLTTQEMMQSNGGSLLQAESTEQSNADGTEAAKTGYDNLYAVAPAKPHVLKKHDLVNIVVNEESKSQTGGTSDQERQVDFDAKVDAFVKFELAKFSLAGGAEGANPPEVKLEGQRDFKGTGEYDRSDTMTTRLEAEVLDVKPNGTLVIQARRHLKIDEEDVNVSLTGTCRVEDVDASNSVLSTDLLDLDLQKSTKGEVHDTTKRGLLHRLLDIVNPF